MGVRQVARFFLVVPLVSRTMLATFAAVCVGGLAAIAVDVAYASRALAPALLLQLFAASSGFLVPARRGHYDLLFTGGASRVVVALMHWLMSSMPGVLTWVVLATGERLAGGADLLSSGTMAALVLVSTLPWTITVPLPRLSGAIVWLVVALTGTAMAGESLTGAALPPWDWVGAQLRQRALVAALLTGGLAVAAAVEWIRQVDLALESGQ